MANSKVELRGYVESLPDGSVSIAPTPMTNATAPLSVQEKILTVGNHSFTPPVGSKGVIITLPQGATTGSRILKGNNADVGVEFPTDPSFAVIPLNKDNLLAVIITASTGDDSEPSTLRFF